jgi:hypothetical protein
MGDNEQISINLQAVPSFKAFGRFLEAANPFAFWALAWSPWIDTARAWGPLVILRAAQQVIFRPRPHA